MKRFVKMFFAIVISIHLVWNFSRVRATSLDSWKYYKHNKHPYNQIQKTPDSKIHNGN